jgi:hypothetical protein
MKASCKQRRKEEEKCHEDDDKTEAKEITAYVDDTEEMPLTSPRLPSSPK